MGRDRSIERTKALSPRSKSRSRSRSKSPINKRKSSESSRKGLYDRRRNERSQRGYDRSRRSRSPYLKYKKKTSRDNSSENAGKTKNLFCIFYLGKTKKSASQKVILKAGA